MKRTTLLILTFTSLFYSCAKAPVSNQDRGPASVEAPTLWGQPVNPQSQDILDEIENAPSGKYNGKYTGNSN